MLPVLFTVGPIAISSFGLFLALSFFYAVFLIWRLAEVWELDQETVLDLCLITAVGGFIFARLFYVLSNLLIFINDPGKIFLIFKYPGLNFWGGFFGGLLVFYLATKYPKFISNITGGLFMHQGKINFKLNYFQLADLAIVGVFMGIVLTSFGCLLGTCQYGLPSNLPFAVPQAGLIGNRFPLQIIEMILFLIAFFYLWRQALKFHFSGQIFSSGLIFLGSFKFILEFFRGNRVDLPFLGVSSGTVFSILVFICGVSVYYRQSKRSIILDIKFILSLSIDRYRRNLVVLKVKKSCYNLLVKFKFALAKWRKNLLKSFNVKSNPPKIKPY